ncbi:MAG: hypothetical protein JW838_06885 [Spirochaetes bacterium]|nr:hypothetical protein [Spirochaetota bacterium]
MRSKATNALQSVVLLTGVVYLVVGLSLFISPYRIMKVFSSSSAGKVTAVVDYSGGGVATHQLDVPELTEEDWLKQTVNDDIISPLYYLFRIFAAFLMIGGIAMVMPLFDPLRYRGLIYYNGLVFPLLSLISLLLFIRAQKSINVEIAAASGREGQAWQGAHTVMIVFTLLFAIILFINAAGLFITKKQTSEGRE